MNVMRPYIEVLEQPAGKAIRFRYEGEKKNYSIIPGVNSTPSEKTYPTIRIVGLDKSVVSIRTTVSCVMKDPPYKIHPHHVVSKDLTSTNGVVSMWTAPQDVIQLQNISIHCVKKKEIQNSLNERTEAGIDPFGQGNRHTKEITSAECIVVRLCFQVILKKSNGFWQCLDPVVSNVIYDNKSFTDLMITRLNTYVCSVIGGQQLVIHAEKVIKQNIKVRFFHEVDGQVVWEAFGNFRQAEVLKQSIILLRVPPYYKQNITEPVTVKVQLVRPSDGETGLAVPFQYLPSTTLGDGSWDGETDLMLKRKRKKFNSSGLLSHTDIIHCRCILKAEIQPDCPIHNPLDFTGLDGNMTRSNQKKPEMENFAAPPNVTVEPGFFNVPHFSTSTGAYHAANGYGNVMVRPEPYNAPHITARPECSDVYQNFNANETTDLSADERFSREIDEYWRSVYGNSAIWSSSFHPPVENVCAGTNNQRFSVPCMENQNSPYPPYYPPPSAVPPLMQYNVQQPEIINNVGALPEAPQVYNNPMSWNIPSDLPAPILQPVVTKVNEDQAVNYEIIQDERNANPNLLDFDEFMCTLSDSISSITICEGESLPENAEKSESNTSNTSDNLMRLCDKTIQQILEISKQQNEVKNTRT